MRNAEDIIKRPLLTEKGNRLKETGGASPKDQAQDPELVKSQVVFEVAANANKIEIRKAVEKLWDVDVTAVHTLRVPGKLKRVGRFVGRQQSWKKALVTLAPGQNIEFFEGV